MVLVKLVRVSECGKGISTRTGAEVTKPLATPVIGGMIGSLLHILIVTPVLFFWLRTRELRRMESTRI